MKNVSKSKITIVIDQLGLVQELSIPLLIFDKNKSENLFGLAFSIFVLMFSTTQVKSKIAH